MLFLYVSAAFGTSGPVHPFFKSKTSDSLCGSHNTASTPPKDPSLCRPLVPVCDRVVQMEATLLGFLTENSLSMSMAPRIVKLLKECARDPAALSKLSMGRASATYKSTYGLAKTLKEEMIEDIADLSEGSHCLWEGAAEENATG